jgi:hypothetical protein
MMDHVRRLWHMDVLSGHRCVSASANCPRRFHMDGQKGTFLAEAET